MLELRRKLQALLQRRIVASSLDVFIREGGRIVGSGPASFALSLARRGFIHGGRRRRRVGLGRSFMPEREALPTVQIPFFQRSSKACVFRAGSPKSLRSVAIGTPAGATPRWLSRNGGAFYARRAFGGGAPLYANGQPLKDAANVTPFFRVDPGERRGRLLGSAQRFKGARE